MPKTPSSTLFKLIKSLSGSEKRYFKVVNTADSNSKYWLLFEAIEAQEEFDEDALQKAVYGDETIHIVCNRDWHIETAKKSRYNAPRCSG